MSLFEKIGNQVGKVAQGIGDVVQDIGDAAKDVGKGIKSSMEASKTTKKKCPNCGEELTSFTSKCPLCGYEFNKVQTSDAVTRLGTEINRLEEKRNIKAELRASRKANAKVSPTDEKIASLIRNFVVPNTIEDIFEFMVMAEGNLDVYQVNISASGNPAIVRSAWEAKFEQTYQKAKLLFGEQVDFKKIQDVYDKHYQDIEKKKPKWFGRK